MERFVLVKEPTCTWAVFDALSNVPAEHEGYVAVGLDEWEAIAFARAANAREALDRRKRADKSASPNMPKISAARRSLPHGPCGRIARFLQALLPLAQQRGPYVGAPTSRIITINKN